MLPPARRSNRGGRLSYRILLPCKSWKSCHLNFLYLSKPPIYDQNHSINTTAQPLVFGLITCKDDWKVKGIKWQWNRCIKFIEGKQVNKVSWRDLTMQSACVTVSNLWKFREISDGKPPLFHLLPRLPPVWKIGSCRLQSISWSQRNWDPALSPSQFRRLWRTRLWDDFWCWCWQAS